MKNAKCKITKIGNSLGVTIPAELLAEAEFTQEELVRLQVEDGTIRLKRNRKAEFSEGISEDFFDVLDETVADYDKTIRGLVDR